MTRIVGFTGRKRSGKDTAALAVRATRVAFAGALKHMLRALLQYQEVDEATIERMIEGDLKEVPTPFLNGHTPRHAMQTLGTEWGRDCMGEDVWVNIAHNLAVNYQDVVIADVRFPNEAASIRDRGGVVVRISRPDNPANDDHPSEAMIDKLQVDADVVNDGSIEDLHSKVQRIINI